MSVVVLALLASLAMPARAPAQSLRGRIVDLSHAFDAATVFWPTEPGFQLEKEFDGLTDKGYYYASNRFCSAEHGGTHIDAPLHFDRAGAPVDQIPLEQLIGVGVLVDVSARTESDRDYQVAVGDFLEWEGRNGRIPNGAIVLLRTGFGAAWPDRRRYLGTDERGPGAVAKLHFPGLLPHAAKWLVDNRKIKAVGLDTASIDHGQSKLFESHRALFTRGVPAFENLANLERLPLKGFTVIALPMKIAGGTGGPLRIIAVVNR